jgi:hypothetical protein
MCFAPRYIPPLRCMIAIRVFFNIHLHEVNVLRHSDQELGDEAEIQIVPSGCVQDMCGELVPPLTADLGKFICDILAI